MSDANIKRAAAEKLRTWGFEVEEIEEAEEERPDLVATDQERRYIIEIKRKFGDTRAAQRWRAKLEWGEVAEFAVSHTRQRTTAGRSRKAASQLAALADRDDDIRLVWHIAVGQEPEALCEQIIATLSGRRGVVDADELPRIECYFFTHSDFYTRRSRLDGAIVSTLDNGRLCINTYSDRKDMLRSSSLARHFGSAILDPNAEESLGRCYIADCEIDRNDEQAVIDYLRQKYRRENLMTLDIGTLSASVLHES